MNYPFVMSMLYGETDRKNQFKPIFHGQLVLIAIVCDRHSLNQLHYEVWSSRFCCACIEHLSYIWMVHQGERLTLSFEAGYYLFCVHAEFYDLQSHFADYRSFLLGHINSAESAFANLLKKLVSSYPGSGCFLIYHGVRIDWRSVEESIDLIVSA